MKMLSSFILLIILGAIPCEEEYKVIDAQTGEPTSAIVCDKRGAFSFDVKVIGGNTCGVAQVLNENNPTGETYVMNENGIIVVGCTKIRADYPKDDGLIVRSVVPQIAQYKMLGHENYVGEQRKEFGRLVVWEKNTAFTISGPNDLPMVIQANGFDSKVTGTIRFDRHFVKDGFYIQVVTIGKNQGDPPFAEILNGKVVGQILVGIDK